MKGKDLIYYKLIECWRKIFSWCLLAFPFPWSVESICIAWHSHAFFFLLHVYNFFFNKYFPCEMHWSLIPSNFSFKSFYNDLSKSHLLSTCPQVIYREGWSSLRIQSLSIVRKIKRFLAFILVRNLGGLIKPLILSFLRQ